MNYHRNKYWPDKCNHGKDCYLFSFRHYINATLDIEKVDVYCFQNGKEQEFCLRTGDLDYQYCSPGNIVNIIKFARNNKLYREVLERLEQIGEITFDIKKDSSES